MLERQVSVALEGGHEDNLERAFDSELQRIIQFYHKKVRLCNTSWSEAAPVPVSSCLACHEGLGSRHSMPPAPRQACFCGSSQLKTFRPHHS